MGLQREQGVTECYGGFQGDTGGYSTLLGVTRRSRGLHKGYKEVTEDYTGLHGVTEGYKGVQGVQGSDRRYIGLQRITRGFKGLQGVTECYKRVSRGFRGLE